MIKNDGGSRSEDLSRRDVLRKAAVLGVGATFMPKLSKTEAASTLQATSVADRIQEVFGDDQVWARLQGLLMIGEALTTTPEPITVLAKELARSSEALSYPALVAADASREPVFPNVKKGDRPALAAFEQPFSNADYFHAGVGEVDVPQYYYRLMSGRSIIVPQIGLNVRSEDKKGALAIIINHFGPTAAYQGCVAQNCYTLAGRVFDMGAPDKVTTAAQALLDHQVGRMTQLVDGGMTGANCSVIEGCKSVEWHVVVIGNSVAQIHWAGLYTPS